MNRKLFFFIFCGLLISLTFNLKAQIIQTGTSQSQANGNIYYTGGSVGIGTTTPYSTLHVQGSSGSTNLARFFNNDYATGIGSGLMITTGSATGDTYTRIQAHTKGATDVGNLIFNPVGGKVGIGTTSPSAFLEVWGTSTSIPIGQFMYYDGSSGTRPRLNIWGSANKINLRTTYGSGGANLSFGTNTVNDALYINENGNVGIGTTAPSTIFQIAKYDASINQSLSNTAAIDIWNTSGAANTGAQINFRSDANSGAAGIGAVIGYLNKGSNASGSYGDLVFGIKNSAMDVAVIQAMIIQKGGNVGIGTTAPAERLTISNTTADATMRLSSGGSATYNADFFLGTNTRDWRMRGGAGGAGGYRLSFSYVGTDAPLSDILSLTKTGKVGIGTVSPGAALEIQGWVGNENPAIRLRSSNSGVEAYDYIEFGQTEGGTWSRTGYIGDGSSLARMLALSTETGFDFGIGVNGNHPYNAPNLFIKASNGFVGIGTNNPTSKLHVNATTYKDIFSIQRSDAAQGNTFEYRITSTPNSVASLSDRSLTLFAKEYAADIAFLTDPAVQKPQVIIKANGKVLIGKTTTNAAKNYLLDIGGTMRADEVVIDLDNGADFVFDKNYKLRSLTEVESFIKANQHLPEIPSAADMKQNGVGLSEMQNKLLQKVEELTLYVIEQQKQIEALKAEIKANKK